MFRFNSLYLCYLFDFSEKKELQRIGPMQFLPDDVCDEDVLCYNLMSEQTVNNYDTVVRRALNRGRRGVAVASEVLRTPNVFQTGTMNVADMQELRTVQTKLPNEGRAVVDDVSLAYLYKKRVIELV